MLNFIPFGNSGKAAALLLDSLRVYLHMGGEIYSETHDVVKFKLRAVTQN